jgi:DNA-binding transcriptional LysR family regulator
VSLRVEDVRLLLAAVDAGSMSRAAKQSFITQQGLSLAIRRVEREIRAELVERSPYGVRLTAQGRAAYESLQRLVCSADSAIQIGRLEHSGDQTLVVGVTSPAAGLAVSALHRLASTMQLRVRQLGFDQLDQTLAHGLADIVITFGPVARPRWTSISLYTERLAILVPRAHPLASATTLQPADVLDETFLSGPSLPAGWPQVGRLESFRHGAVPRLGDALLTDVRNPAEANEMVAARLAVVTAPVSHRTFFPHPLVSVIPLEGPAWCDVVVLDGVREDQAAKRSMADTVIDLLKRLAGGGAGSTRSERVPPRDERRRERRC